MIGDSCFEALGELRYDLPRLFAQLTQAQLYGHLAAAGLSRRINLRIRELKRFSGDDDRAACRSLLFSGRRQFANIEEFTTFRYKRRESIKNGRVLGAPSILALLLHQDQKASVERGKGWTDRRAIRTEKADCGLELDPIRGTTGRWI